MPKRAPSGNCNTGWEEKGCHHRHVIGVASVGPGGWSRGQQRCYRGEVAVGRQSHSLRDLAGGAPGRAAWEALPTEGRQLLQDLCYELDKILCLSGCTCWSAPFPSTNNICDKSWAWPGSVAWRWWRSPQVTIMPYGKPATRARRRTRMALRVGRSSGVLPLSDGTWSFARQRRSRSRFWPGGTSPDRSHTAQDRAREGLGLAEEADGRWLCQLEARHFGVNRGECGDTRQQPVRPGQPCCAPASSPATEA